jgi:hypothetical protein
MSDVMSADEYLEYAKSLIYMEHDRMLSILSKMTPEERWSIAIKGLITTSDVDATSRTVCEGDYRMVITRSGKFPIVEFEIFRGEHRISKLYRNHHSVWYKFVFNHPVTNKDYLLCGEDYQGLTILDLNTGSVDRHLPLAAHIGQGWCVLELEVVGAAILAQGCYWGGPLEYRVWDFRNPIPDFDTGYPSLLDDYICDDAEDDSSYVYALVPREGMPDLVESRASGEVLGTWVFNGSKYIREAY